jgi:hypothetical protein
MGGKRPKKSRPYQVPTNQFLSGSITEFLIPTHAWKVPSETLEEVLSLERFVYSKPKSIKFKGQPLLSITVKRNDKHEGYIYVPIRYQELWRRLRYSVFYWEKALQWYEEKIKAFGTSRTPTEEGIEILRDNAGVKYVQYLICQRKVLEELMKIRFDHVNALHLQTFLEFGIRHFRDWLHDDFSYAQKAGSSYLSLDPTEPANMAKFSELKSSRFRTSLTSVQKQGIMGSFPLRWSLPVTITGGMGSLTSQAFFPRR